ncbi:uncharacterized protein B0H64DRAFT_394985 [Chaetomium fimeti]|uniref:NmrA-like domain-containing protein n=1 Tax=Chaetomium fimeti TaxID=1854472 RepID=A0AAE0HFN1_9PEZI|nr:hypothetical protein B0H64DRAFT_394985 [Chaetomium fimeti]
MTLLPDLTNFNAELEAGTTILAVAKAAGVQHVVYSTTVPVPETEPDHFAALAFKPKLMLEKALPEAGFPRWTILRPGFFMPNYLSPKVNAQFPGAAEEGLFTTGFRPTSMLPMVDHEDIGKFAVAAFQQPDRFHAQGIDVISQAVTVEQSMETMRRVLGRPEIRARYLDGEELRAAQATNPVLIMHELLGRVDPYAGVDPREAVEKWGVEMTTFEEFIVRERKDFDETYRNV